MNDFGGKLRQARERRGISLRQIAASTKISGAALEALERNDITKLPGGIFSRAFVRSYAVAVGLDPEETVREFLARFNQEGAPPPDAPAAPVPEQVPQFDREPRKTGRTAGLVVVAVSILAAIGYFGLRGRSKTSAQPSAAQSAQAAPEVPPPPPLPRAAPATVAPAPEIGAPSAPAGQITLDLHPTADCWISLTIDGRKRFGRVVKPGEHESHTVAREAIVEVGDAGAFAYSINGRPGRSLGAKGQVKTLRLTPATAEQFVR
jgi:cytoskeletal protein RodZ